MRLKLTPIAAAAFALAGGVFSAHAQQTPSNAPDDKGSGDQNQKVEVTGIRASLRQSLNQKRNADTHVDVITAEDIGKMPEKNVADSLQRLPGVTISSAGATEGGFDENDRVSIRGTNPSLTCTLINGHPVSSGDWFVLNQGDNGGRSVSYTLLPSEIVQTVVVHKSAQASLPECGVAGTVNIITRKPLGFNTGLTLEASAGGVYSDLPKKTDPQFQALMNYKNEAGTAGVTFQVFYEKRSLRRDGVEVLGYDQIAPGSPIALANPSLSGVFYPRMIGAAFFEQVRERTGGLLELEIKPSNELTLDASAFLSKLDAKNYNRNYLLFNPFILAGGTGQAPLPGFQVRNNTLVSASFAPDPTRTYGLYDQISRPDEGAETKFVDLGAKYRASDAWKIEGRVGTSRGLGKTPTQDVAEWDVGLGQGASWQLNGIDNGASFTLNQPANSPTQRRLDFIFGDQNIRIKDQDDWAQLDNEYAIDKGALTTLKFGARIANHKRESKNVIGQGPLPAAFTLTNWPSTFSNYPSDYASGIAGNFPRDVWFFTQDQMSAVAPGLSNRDPVARRRFPAEFGLHEKSNAVYVQANLEGTAWRGDVGLRLVETKESVFKWLPADAATPGAVLGSAFGPFIGNTTDNTYHDVLPSFNLRLDVQKDLVVRFGVARTMARPDYSALAGSLNLSPPATPTDVGGGTASNPNLRPIRSTNTDAALEWYFAPRSLLSAGVFQMNLSSYVSQGTVRQQYMTFNGANPTGFLGNYDVTVPVNARAKIKGVELAGEAPVFGNFGVAANYTYADAHEASGGPVVGASRNTYNLIAYYEDDRFNARLAYNFRSKFFSGLDRATAFSQDDTASLAASVGYNISKNLSITLDARNLNNPKLKYFALNEDQPRAIYQNGRQYYLTLRAKM